MHDKKYNDSILYLGNKDYAYKFDKEKETLEPLAELNIFEHEEKSEYYGGVYHVYMFSDEAGYVQYDMCFEEPNPVIKNIKIYKK